MVANYLKGAGNDVRSAAKGAIGKKLDISGVTWSDAPVNLVLAIRSNCPFCEASIPLYRQVGPLGRGGARKCERW